MKAKSKKIMGLFLALVMLLGCLPFNIIETYAAPGDVAIDATNFPDENFRKYVKDNFDNNPADGVLSQAEIDAVTEINFFIPEISDLKGVGFFKKLTTLRCNVNQLTSLDVSHNTALESLDCGRNQLISLDVSHNTALKSLSCEGNQLTSLDVSQNTALKSLSCEGNQLTSLDVSHNTALNQLRCGENHLKSLDVSQNTALNQLWCGGNQLTSLDVSQNTALNELWCEENQLTSLDVSQNTALNQLYCSGNQLTSLDVSQNTALNYLDCGGNQLTSLDVSKNTVLRSLSCEENQLTSLDVSHNKELTVYGSGNPLTIVKLPDKNPDFHFLEPKYVIEVPEKTSVIKFPEGFNPKNIVGSLQGLMQTNDGFEWDEQTNIKFKYRLCDSPELIVDVTVETKTVPNPAFETAKQLVEKAETDKTEDSYTSAKAAVEGLAKGSGKAELEKN